jgi:hypothetical protein
LYYSKKSRFLIYSFVWIIDFLKGKKYYPQYFSPGKSNDEGRETEDKKEVWTKREMASSS